MKPYILSPDQEKEVKDFIKENLKLGRIRPSQSPMGSPVFFVKKKSGKLRLCQDYRYLNEHTISDAYPIPRIDDLLKRFQKAKYFFKIDLKWGYNNVRIKEGDQWKAAFSTQRGLFEPTVMFFGLKNSPPTFQRLMDDVIQGPDIIKETALVKRCDKNTLVKTSEEPEEPPWVEVYMDDTLGAGETKEECRKEAFRTLRKLRKAGLPANIDKCAFEVPEVDFLGFIIGHGKIRMDPDKIKGLTEWPIPTKLKEVRSFLGFGNFYRRFIKNYSTIAAPLHALQGKDIPFVWSDECNTAFNRLKEKFTSYPVLHLPNPDQPYQIEADASKYASGAVLTQLDEHGARHPICFMSKTFDSAQKNYEIYDRELLAIIRALEEWRPFIQGSPFVTTVYSDHQNLTYWKNPQRLSPRQARAFLTLSKYNFELKHQPGTKMFQSDALSRRPDLCLDEEDPKEVIMLPPDLFVNLIDTALQEQILNSDKMELEAADALKLLLEEGPTDLQNAVT